MSPELGFLIVVTCAAGIVVGCQLGAWLGRGQKKRQRVFLPAEPVVEELSPPREDDA